MLSRGNSHVRVDQGDQKAILVSYHTLLPQQPESSVLKGKSDHVVSFLKNPKWLKFLEPVVK